MSESNRLQADPLFQGLTRPPMLFGVSYSYFVFNFLGTIIAFSYLKSILIVLLVGPLIHGLGYLLCMNEPRAVELFALRMNTSTKCRNRLFHSNTNSYDVY